MRFSEILLKEEYKTPRDNIIEEFYIPVISNACIYKRAVGYFSSSSLIKFTRGLSGLIKNGGKVKLITSPNLSVEDFEAINRGISERDRLIEKKLLDAIYDPKDYFETERLNLLANLIANGDLEIKIAFSCHEGNLGLYHEKLGILKNFESDEMIAFSGSMNETENAFENNFESIDVFTSWNDNSRVLSKNEAFESLWTGNEENAKIFDFPEAVKKSLLKYKGDKVNLYLDEEELEKIREEYNCYKREPCEPSWLHLRLYQEEAIVNWEKNNFKGIYDMATGTGKTLTALSSIMRLYTKLNGRLAIIICAPYQHLVDQWCEDLDNYNFEYIVGHSNSCQRNWKKKLDNSVFNYNNRIKNSICFITTNASFKTKYVQNILNTIKVNKLLVVDEAHNFGSPRLIKLLNGSYNYRLALSATFERQYDDIANQKLLEFFDKKCIVYGLKEAIEQNMLTKYKYYPIPVYLNVDELEQYNEISSRIAKSIKKDANGKVTLTKIAEMLLIQRARIVAGAHMKIKTLEGIMSDFKNKNNILVYCGATLYSTEIDDDYKAENNELRQIEAVEQMLANKLGMKICQFTSQESSIMRNEIKRDFASQRIQAIVAIKCLDEGVNIPCIENVFILASSTNPKEYVQRRGRVLRKAPGKLYANIYDFVTLPRNLDTMKLTDDSEYDIGLIKRELIRVNDFASLALNTRDSDKLIDMITEKYGVAVNSVERDEDYEYY